jgi:hypothetical protein
MTAAKTNEHRGASGGRGARHGTRSPRSAGTSRSAGTARGAGTPRSGGTSRRTGTLRRAGTGQRAGTGAHASRPSRAKTSRLARTLTDHDEIRRWAEERGGKPTAVKGTSRGKRDVGMIRIDFPGYSGEGKLEPIDWEQWFEKFDESNLALIVQEKTANGEISHFNKLVAREGPGSRRARRQTSR